MVDRPPISELKFLGTLEVFVLETGHRSPRALFTGREKKLGKESARYTHQVVWSYAVQF